jgi:hypothetical protein
MIERLKIERQSHATRAAPIAAEQLRLSLAWHLDPITGKPVAQWVLGGPELSSVQELLAVA